MHRKQGAFCQSNQEFHLTLANLVNIFEALNSLNWTLQCTNINCIIDYSAINAVMAKLGLDIVQFISQQRGRVVKAPGP